MPEGRAPTGHREVAWLVLRAQAGDRAALEKLLWHAQELLRPYVRAMVRDADEASDVLQEVLILVYRKLNSLREPRVFAAWARRVAAREVFRWARTRRPTESFLDELPEAADEEHDPVVSDDLRARLPALLEKISPASRAVIVMHYLEGLSIEETAAVLDIPAGTAKSRLAYGLRALRRLMPRD